MRIKFMKRLLAVVLILALALPVCAKKHQSEEIITPQTQLEKRKYQTRTYKAKDQIAVLKSILNVLQDDGYIVYNVNSLLGFIYAVKDFDTTDPNIDISKEFGLTKSRLNYNGVKVATLETSANVTQYGDNIRVRINFKRKLLNEYGNAQFIDDVSEAQVYDDFYAKLEKALSLHKELNTPKVVPVSENSDSAAAKPEKEVIITPDLKKEINDNIKKVINSDAPKIPEITAPQEQKVKDEKPVSDVKPSKEPQVEKSKEEKITEDKSKEAKKEIKPEENQKEEKAKEKKQNTEEADSKKQDEPEKKKKKSDKETEKEQK